MTLGARYTEDNKDADEFRTRELYGFATRIPTGAAAGFWSAIPFAFYNENNRQNHLSGDWHATTGTAGLEWTPTDDSLFGKGTIRADGRKIHDMYLFEVKKPAESKAPWDYYKLRATIPAAQAFRPIDQGDCPLVKK